MATTENSQSEPRLSLEGDVRAEYGQMGTTVFVLGASANLNQDTDFENQYYYRYVITASANIVFTLGAIDTFIQRGYGIFIRNGSAATATLTVEDSTNTVTYGTLPPGANLILVARRFFGGVDEWVVISDDSSTTAFQANIIYVDATYGPTTPNSPDKIYTPYATLAQANTAAAAESGQVMVLVRPGFYIVSATLSTTGVYWFFQPRTFVVTFAVITLFPAGAYVLGHGSFSGRAGSVLAPGPGMYVEADEISTFNINMASGENYINVYRLVDCTVSNTGGRLYGRAFSWINSTKSCLSIGPLATRSIFIGHLMQSSETICSLDGDINAIYYNKFLCGGTTTVAIDCFPTASGTISAIVGEIDASAVTTAGTGIVRANYTAASHVSLNLPNVELGAGIFLTSTSGSPSLSLNLQRLNVGDTTTTTKPAFQLQTNGFYYIMGNRIITNHSATGASVFDLLSANVYFTGNIEVGGTGNAITADSVNAYFNGVGITTTDDLLLSATGSNVSLDYNLLSKATANANVGIEITDATDLTIMCNKCDLVSTVASISVLVDANINGNIDVITNASGPGIVSSSTGTVAINNATAITSGEVFNLTAGLLRLSSVEVDSTTTSVIILATTAAMEAFITNCTMTAVSPIVSSTTSGDILFYCNEGITTDTHALNLAGTSGSITVGGRYTATSDVLRLGTGITNLRLRDCTLVNGGGTPISRGLPVLTVELHGDLVDNNAVATNVTFIGTEVTNASIA